MPAPPDSEWLRSARIDLDSAEVLAAHGGHADTICFLCQQSVEKVLKGLLAAAGSAPPKIHDLVALRARLGEAAATPGVADEDIAFLSSCYLASRYPTLERERRTWEDAERSLRIARAVLGRGVP